MIWNRIETGVVRVVGQMTGVISEMKQVEEITGDEVKRRQVMWYGLNRGRYG